MSALVKWSPLFESFDDMEKKISELMPMLRDAEFGFVPAVDVYEDKDKIVVEAQLAGIDPEDIRISIENDVLSLSGVSEKKSEVEEKNYYRKEIRHGSFYRTISLPAHVDKDKAEAVTEGGVLKISVPRLKGKSAKNIEIKKK